MTIVTDVELAAGYHAAIKACNGNQSKLARLCGVKPQSVQDWAARGIIPSKRVLIIEKETGVHRGVLRPDLYPPEEKAA